jgi:hypothetical protein
LTDGTTSIEATFTAGCLNDPNNLVPSTTPNNLLRVQKYTLRFAYYGPARSQLTLVLHTVRWLGVSGGAHTELKPITSCEQVADALQKLRKIRLEADRRCFLAEIDSEDTMAPSGSRTDEQGVSQTSSPNTQLPFGTQMAHPYRHRTSNESPGHKRMEPLSVGYTGEEEARIHKANHQAAQHAQLLSLLDPNRSHSVAPPLPPVAPSAGGFARISTSNQQKDTGAHVAALKTPALPGRPNHARDDHTNTWRLTSPPAQNHPSSARLSSSHKKIANDTNLDLEPQRQAVDTEMDIEPQPMFDRNIFEPTSSELNEVNLDDREPEWLRSCRPNCESAIASWKQRMLLSKAESWQKPEAGLRFPDANIPITILTKLKEHMSTTAEDEASSPNNSGDEDGELPDGNGDEDVVAGVDAEPPTSQVSWSSSPAPESPQRLGLPPDSSFDGNRNNSTQQIHHDVGAKQKRGIEPVIIESSNGNAIPPSSPPSIQDENGSDEEMELEVPRALGESPDSNRRISAPVSLRQASVVQVKETPYAKGTNGPIVLPAQQQTSSGQSKDTSSASIICGTYKDKKTSSDKETVDTVVGNTLPAATSTQEISVSSHEPVTGLQVEGWTPGEPTKHVHYPAARTSDIFMEDAPSEHHQKAANPPVAARSRPSMLLESSPISAQRPAHSLSSSGERAPDLTQPKLSDPIKLPASISEGTHLKRKLNNSPSKKSNRLSKRREIKIVAFGHDSPPRYTAAEFHQARKDSLDRFRETRRSEFTDTDLAGNQRLASTLRSTTDMPMEARVMQADAEPEQPHPARKPFGDMRRNLSGHIHEGEPNHRLSDDGSSSPPRRSHRAPPLVHHDSTEMDLDHPLANEMNAQNPTRKSHPTPSDTTLVGNKAVHVTLASKGHDVSQDPMSASGQLLRSETVFQIFKNAYPDYTGGVQHFMAQCKQMHKLDLEDKMVPKWQWDDFIVRNRTDYKDYIFQCSELGEDPEPYYRYYKDNIRDTLYRKGVIKNREVLLTALEELGHPTASPVASKAPANPSRKSLPWASSQVDGSPFEHNKSDHSRMSLPAGTRRPRPSLDATSPLHPTPLHNTSTSGLSAIRSTSKSNTKGGSSTPISQNSFDGSIPGHLNTRSKIPPPTGDVYRDFVFGWQRATSFTGSTKVNPALRTKPT